MGELPRELGRAHVFRWRSLRNFGRPELRAAAGVGSRELDVEVDAAVKRFVQLLPAVGRQDGDAAEVPGLFKWTHYDSTGGRGSLSACLPAYYIFLPFFAEFAQIS